MPDTHAQLSPSSAHRWIQCPPSVRLSADIPDKGSVYAEEGTRAHKLGEELLRELYENGAEPELPEDKSMVDYMTAYRDFVSEHFEDAKKRDRNAEIRIEQRVTFGDYIPDAFGTADCIIMENGHLEVIDFKYGKGVKVEAQDNAQMKIYALGAFLEADFLFDIQTISMTIYQPRMDNIQTVTISTEELTSWAQRVLKPAAELAARGQGAFNPGEETCRWCRARATCRAYHDFIVEQVRDDFADTPPDTLSPDEIAQCLTFIPLFTEWANSVKDYALSAMVNGQTSIPGYKLVRGRKTRIFKSEESAAQISNALAQAGYSESDVFEYRMKSIAQLERLIGKTRFSELCDAFITRTDGKPTLVPDTDPRPAMEGMEGSDDMRGDFDDD